METMIEILINGEKRNFESGVTVLGLLEQVVSVPEGVAVELNLEIIDRKEFSSTVLREGDSLEIIRFVGGGSL